MQTLFEAIALVLVLEGLLYAAFPFSMLKMLEQMRDLPPSTLRAAGLIAAIIGVGLLYVLRGTGGL